MTLALTATAALWFLPFVLPIAVWVAWSDMARMKIPNKAVLALLAVFALVGVIVLPLPEYGWRWVHAAAVLAVGFVANAAGLMGAGDAKFAAAMAPFIALSDAVTFIFLFSAVMIAAFVLHRLVRALPVLRRTAPGWESWSRKDFPMGLALGPALAFYLAAGVAWGS